ncbi:hypothetical protein MesoLjLc_34130 [Mesorhizobium sp. L-8-10]|uniref:KTSC domain-containing protein n=1 Tax=unclassified Mesorhizobium TaxID=325217 RepID=UPI0019295CBB|nr:MULTISPECIES: KTSC domain-containing protein [unclassified Mesorhizobium]BCH23755.1 hypothetical protein MesoLjLb_35400 [Mesorhizobium sp. L-8-3]BCH31483.1 hypothetical protein MesoLjLc_34130 [Mesorhizobium sp. L-8-10]
MRTVEQTDFPGSSVVRPIRYAPDDDELEVRLVNGTAYLYFEVPWIVVDAFREAPSPGRFFNQEIVNRYRYNRLR